MAARVLPAPRPAAPAINSDLNQSRELDKVMPGLSGGKIIKKELMATTEASEKIGHRADETFITQKGGKIVEKTQQIYIPVIQNEVASTSIEHKRTLQSTLLLQKKKEMNHVQTQLEKKRVEFAKRMEECREKQEELRTKQKQLRERVLRFEKFLKENDAKRQRANLKIQMERKVREQKEQELGSLQKQMNDVVTKSQEIQTLNKQYSIYEAYLQSVVTSLPPDYLDVAEPNVNDILMRHKTLEETSADLSRILTAYQAEIESEQKALSDLIKEKNDTILVFNSQLGTHQKELDKMKQECVYLEQKAEERNLTWKERMRILGETKLAINNIYERVGFQYRIQGIQPAVVLPLPTAAFSNINNNIPGANPVAAAAIPAAQVSSAPNQTDIREKTLAEKLTAIQERVIDLTHIAQKAEQFVHVEQKKKQALQNDKDRAENNRGGFL